MIEQSDHNNKLVTKALKRIDDNRVINLKSPKKSSVMQKYNLDIEK